MYGERSGVDARTWLAELLCWHRPELTNRSEYECSKCGQTFDLPLWRNEVSFRQLIWLFTGRLPRRE